MIDDNILKLSREELIERLGIFKPSIIDPTPVSFSAHEQYEFRTGRKIAKVENENQPIEPSPTPPVAIELPVKEEPVTEEKFEPMDVYEIPKAPFEHFPPGILAKDFDSNKMAGFINGHLKFRHYSKVDDVDLQDREAYTEYKVKLRLRDLQRPELANLYRKVAMERTILDYSLLRTG
jgi:hypothetical protein